MDACQGRAAGTVSAVTVIMHTWDGRAGRPSSSGGRAGDLDVVGRTDDVDTVARALGGGGNHLQTQVRGHIGAAAGIGEEFVTLLDVGEAVYVEFKHLGRVLDAEAVTGAQVLIDPDPEHVVGHGS
jgi:hypothetical protein